uniref:Uncharacterized protein n=1 Tax=Meloidogyne enterolobii TaxID=390850 RepID=A0A6V7WCF5_MELEN|nr:unnamed protein product [Meloidogyne enterolobii]
MRKIPSHTLPNKKEAEETRSLDRHLFSVRWNKRGTSTTKINCKNNIRPSLKATTTQILEKKKNNNLICDNSNGRDDFDSPAVALIDPCTSSASSPATAAVQNSSCFQQQPSVPQRLACFLSKRLKRTKSFPKLASALGRDKLTATTTTLNGIGKQGEHQLKIRASLGSNALRTDQQQQQQRSQPLSLYLPGPTEEKLKTSRSYESLLLLSQAGGCNNNNSSVLLQKSPSESEHKMLLQPFPNNNNKQPQQFPNLSSPLDSNNILCSDNNRSNIGGVNGYWHNSNTLQTTTTIPMNNLNNNFPQHKYQQQKQQQLNNRHQQQSSNNSSRIENSLSIWILEAKGIPPKRKFFCEISLDNIIKAKTSSKSLLEGICFWGENFDFQKLPFNSQQLCIDLMREPEMLINNGGKKRRGGGGNGKSSHEELHCLVGLVRIPLSQLVGKQPIEKWYLISSGEPSQTSSSSSTDSQPSLRLKARYQSVQILPLNAYLPFRKSLHTYFLPLCTAFEPILGVKAKEDFANSLVKILHIERNAPEALAELVMAEVLTQENDHLLFRGNSLATKAVEAYMKLVATDYLQMALGDFIRQLLSSDLSCEVDPLRLCNGNASSSGSSSSGSGSSISSQLEKSRQQLTRQVETAWRRILACQHLFPYPLRLLFSGLRHRLEQAGRAELTDNLLSSSIFLRFLCPAILSPSLFGLVNEYPTGQAARNLTLIAKSLQTLANFTRFGGKEGYMEFMNNFVEREWRNMQHFLRQISAPCARYCQACEAHDSMVDCTIDLGKELSLLASYMREHCDQLMEQRKENLNLNKNSNTTTTLIAIKQLWNSLMTISNWGNNCCDKEEEKEEEGNFGMASTNIEGGHSPGNPPSDYENNNTVITTTTAKVPESLWRQQPPPIPMARRTVMIPQPIEISSRGNLYGGGEGCQPISAPPVPNSPFSEQKTHFSFSSSGNNNNNNSSSYVSTAAVHHLNTSDDYVLSSALSKLRTTTTTTKLLDPPIKQQYWNSNNSSCIHLYDETTSCNNKRGVDNLQQQQQQHLYDEVPTDTNLTILPPPSASRALNAGVVIAHRGVASHEATQRRGELCTPRVIQRNAFRAVDDEADDESESEEDGRVQEIVEENEEFNLRRPPPNRRRRPPSANGYTNSSLISHVRNCSSGEQQQQQQHYGIFNESINNFDSSSASVGSNNRKKNIGGINQMIIPPSSGYQSQLNSSRCLFKLFLPTNTTESSPPPSQQQLQQQQTTSIINNLIQSPKILLKNPPKISKNIFSSNIISTNNSCQSSSSSSASSAYSSLSPTNQQNQQQQQNLFNNKLRKSAENAAMHLLEELNCNKSEQQTRTELQQQHLPKPRTNPSCWSIPASSSGHLQQQQPQPRSAFIGSNPTDPLTAFVRYPLHSSSSPQKISPKKLEEEKEDYQRKFPQNSQHVQKFIGQKIIIKTN